MKSMTGYGYHEYQTEELFLSAEIKGYNSRYLEMSVNLPHQLSGLDHEIRRYMAERCRRGKLEINLQLKEYDSGFSVSVNPGAVKAYVEALVKAVDILSETEILFRGFRGISYFDTLNVNMQYLLGLEGVLEIEKAGNAKDYWQKIEPVLQSAAEKFEADRVREGAHTEADILSHIQVLESAAAAIAVHVPALEASIKETLKTRFLELQKDIDENRIFAETAVLLMKYTISEELSRLSAHLAEFRAEIKRNPGPGKKLDFLCQELNREINTIGAKTPILEVSRGVVDMKDALENIREQLRNVE